jgi:hypothetical protein
MAIKLLLRTKPRLAEQKFEEEKRLLLMAFTPQLAITDVSFHKRVLFMQVAERVYGSKERLLILFHPIYWPMFARQYCLTFQSKQLLRKSIDSKHNRDHKRWE